jgi:DNA helicase IV
LGAHLRYHGSVYQPCIRQRLIGDQFGHVLVDEYQDTNALQAQIVIRMKLDGRGLAVVGDDAQSIYSFRASSVRNILDFPKQFLPTAHAVALEQNYRSRIEPRRAAWEDWPKRRRGPAGEQVAAGRDGR